MATTQVTRKYLKNFGVGDGSEILSNKPDTSERLRKFVEAMRQSGIGQHPHTVKVIALGAKGRATVDELVIQHSKRALEQKLAGKYLLNESEAALRSNRERKLRGLPPRD